MIVLEKMVKLVKLFCPGVQIAKTLSKYEIWKTFQPEKCLKDSLDLKDFFKGETEGRDGVLAKIFFLF